MRGDFSRDSFDPARHFSRVLLQQGRVQLDADANEQTSILLHYLRTLATDLIGRFGGPATGDIGFEIGVSLNPNDKLRIADLTIGDGHYYVDGILCECEPPRPLPPAAESGEDRAPGRDRRRERAAATPQPLPVSYYNQPDLALDEAQNKLPDLPFLVYLDVWERLITAVEEPEIRDPALGINGPDTAARAKVVWQVRVTRELPEGLEIDGRNDDQIRTDLVSKWNDWIEVRQPPNRGLLLARGREGEPDVTDVCIVDPEARYRGEENQLYRVEVHAGGAAPKASFKWSRDNGAVVFPIESLEGELVTLQDLGRDLTMSLQVGDWVEIADDVSALSPGSPEPGGGADGPPPPPLSRIAAIDPIERTVTLERAPAGDVGREPNLHPLLRRWDQRAGDTSREKTPKINADGTLKLEENVWLTLEDGVQIYFQALSGGDPQRYRAGDYWLIPARWATGDVIWPGEEDSPEPLPPHGVEHHYAPLALVTALDRRVDLRLRFNYLTALAAATRRGR
jgi:hypothetical protein